MSDARLPALVQALGPAITHLEVQSQFVSEADEASLLGALTTSGAEGWVCLTDAVKTLERLRRDGAPRSPSRLLSAERWLDGESMHVRPEEGGWRVVRTREVEEAEEAATPTLAFDEVLLGDRSPDHRVRVYWRRDTHELGAPWRPWLAAFRGFALPEGGA